VSSILDLAIAVSVTDFATSGAAEALVQARAGFQLTGEQLLQAADTMVKVAAASSADVGDVMRGLRTYLLIRRPTRQS